MDRINLLPDNLVLTTWPNRLRFWVDRRFLPTLGRAAAGALALVVLIAAGVGIAVKSYEARTRALETRQRKTAAELEEVRAVAAELEEKERQLLQQIDWQKQRLAYLRQYQDPSGQWAEILREIKRALPYGVWLTELEGDPHRLLRLAGGAFQEDLVTEFMGDLKEISRFQDVAFNFAKKATVGRTEVVQFEVICRVVEGPK